MNNDEPKPAFSAGQVLLATFLGGPLGGTGLMAINRRRVDHWDGPQSILVIGVGWAIISAALMFVLPENFPAHFIYPAQFVIMHKWYEHDQSALYQHALAQGVNQASWWSAIGFGVLAMVGSFCLLVLLFGIFILR